MITAVPTPLEVITPPTEVTVATSGLLLENSTLYAASLLGSAVLRSNSSPTPSVMLALLRESLAGAFLTVTVQVAVLPL